ncbi:hypothetical protein GA0115246_110412 [Streptomyces sp. SolWspMP-sol7th]|nr:hypothetical protein GA0115246_110412 [Streptomyces sp. SolWspMP-sol7th]
MLVDDVVRAEARRGEAGRRGGRFLADVQDGAVGRFGEGRRPGGEGVALIGRLRGRGWREGAGGGGEGLVSLSPAVFAEVRRQPCARVRLRQKPA